MAEGGLEERSLTAEGLPSLQVIEGLVPPIQIPVGPDGGGFPAAVVSAETGAGGAPNPAIPTDADNGGASTATTNGGSGDLTEAVVPNAGNGDAPDAVAATAEGNGDAGMAADLSEGNGDGSADVVASAELTVSEEPGDGAMEDDEEKEPADESDS